MSSGLSTVELPVLLRGEPAVGDPDAPAPRTSLVCPFFHADQDGVVGAPGQHRTRTEIASRVTARPITTCDWPTSMRVIVRKGRLHPGSCGSPISTGTGSPPSPPAQAKASSWTSNCGSAGGRGAKSGSEAAIRDSLLYGGGRSAHPRNHRGGSRSHYRAGGHYSLAGALDGRLERRGTASGDEAQPRDL
jgi:hypothetical protein